jgi:hypothetical protein
MEPAQKLQRIGHLGSGRIKALPFGRPHRIEAPDRQLAIAVDPLPKKQKSLISQRE